MRETGTVGGEKTFKLCITGLPRAIWFINIASVLFSQADLHSQSRYTNEPLVVCH